MDKRRYVSRNPRNPRSPMSMEDEVSGNPAVDGFTVRHRQPLKRDSFAKDSRYSEHYAAGGLLTEGEAMIRDVFGDE